MRQEAADDLGSRLAEYQLELHFGGQEHLNDLQPGVIQHATLVHRKRATAKVRVLYTPKIVFTEAAKFAQDGPPLLVLGPRVQERSAEMLRGYGVNFLDQLGNANFNFYDFAIDIRGRRPTKLMERSSVIEPSQSINLFSPKRSQVIFAILSWPELAHASVRKLAFAAGVSVGQVQDTLQWLQASKFLGGARGRQLRNASDLLDQWAAAYPSGLGSRAAAHGFAGESTHFESVDDDIIYVSGEAAVPDLLHSETLTVYMEEFTPRLIRQNHWRTDLEPNIFVRRKFWQSLDEDPPLGTIQQAPPLLIYADLRASRDGRQLEAAEQFRRTNDQLQRL